jgi:16S rRNA (cytosine967-C5)-methyltransferase
VDEQVKLAKAGIRHGAAGLINAVLRKIDDMVVAVEPDTPWAPAADLIPLDRGCVRLNGPILPEIDRVARHLGVATSHPKFLVNRWIGAFGEEQTTLLCLHGIERPPIIVAVGTDFDTTPKGENWEPHLVPGYIVWKGEHRGLVEFLRDDPARRVQDPASALPVGCTRELAVKTALDYCAGRGTKTRQIALLHPQAQVAATDVDDVRRAALIKAMAGLDNVTVVGPVSRPASKLDLLVLDVPCSNTAVLARRPEARYRLDARTLDSLVTLQRDIIRQTHGWVAPGGHILYSTCSLERDENQAQAHWLAKQTGGQVVHEHQELPAGFDTRYQDGGYHALIKTAG